ncbi:MAG TPA: hypothetical protein VGD65_07570 [Chryseosolibacter sp.]
MGHTLQLQFVKKISDPANHQFTVSSPDGLWDYVDLDDEFDIYAIYDSDSISFYESLISKGHWRRGVIDFLKKTDGRFYGGDEGYEPTIYSPAELKEFADLLEKELEKPDINSSRLQRQLQPDKRGRIPMKDELHELKQIIEIAKANDYYFKCLDR